MSVIGDLFIKISRIHNMEEGRHGFGEADRAKQREDMGLPELPGHAFLALGSSWRTTVVYIYYVTADGNSIS
jgi:hypothetical protein